MLCCDLLLKVVSESPGSEEEDGTPELLLDSLYDSDDFIEVQAHYMVKEVMTLGC